jgi:hypothetical protein
MGRPAWQIRIITLFWPWRNQLARMCGWPILRRWLGRTFQGDEARYIPVRVEIPQAGSWILPDPLDGKAAGPLFLPFPPPPLHVSILGGVPQLSRNDRAVSSWAKGQERSIPLWERK